MKGSDLKDACEFCNGKVSTVVLAVSNRNHEMRTWRICAQCEPRIIQSTQRHIDSLTIVAKGEPVHE